MGLVLWYVQKSVSMYGTPDADQKQDGIMRLTVAVTFKDPLNPS